MATPALTPRRGTYLEPKDEDDSPRSSTHAPSPAMALKHFLAVLRKNWMLVGVVLSIAGARAAPAVGARDGNGATDVGCRDRCVENEHEILREKKEAKITSV